MAVSAFACTAVTATASSSVTAIAATAVTATSAAVTAASTDSSGSLQFFLRKFCLGRRNRENEVSHLLGVGNNFEFDTFRNFDSSLSEDDFRLTHEASTQIRIVPRFGDQKFPLGVKIHIETLLKENS